MRFTLTCVKGEDTRLFYYDNATGLLHNDDGSPIGQPNPELSHYVPAFKADPVKNPIRKVADVRVLKIQLGLSCNYSCSYCLQRYVPGAEETSRKHVDGFLEKLKRNIKGQPEKIELWGGEPLVYIKTLRPLVPELRKMYPSAKFSMITNGSLLTTEINDWIMEYNIAVSISHDGPGQSVRGDDPFDKPETAQAIADLYWRKKQAGDQLGFGAMIHAQNPDRAAVYQWLADKINDPDIVIGEGAVIETYDEGAKENGLNTLNDQLNIRRISYENTIAQKDKNFSIVQQRMNEWFGTMQHGRMLDSVGMKCGMDKSDVVTVDLEGNVLTCQNINRSATAANGQSHKGGSIDNFHGIEIRTSTHFLNRDHCHGCPVVQACKGGCMYLSGDLFYASCNNTYSDHIPFFVAAVEFMTGWKPVRVVDEAGRLPPERQDIFGADLC